MKDNWITPPYIIKRIENVLGPDFFDPCPTDPTFDGLSVSWKHNTFINPPYSRGMLDLWSSKALDEYKALWEKDATNFIWLINYGATLNRARIKIISNAICDLFRRVDFIDPDTMEAGPVGNDRDSILYLWGDKIDMFCEQFSDLGKIFVSKG